ncbi:thiol peroxidase [Marinoscillum sp. MHG1-6]|uniref:thiol peroxidase n=1 Tax=Marinoscillum sp. MHG1-6 TaxID=2959627 RepID=UPI002158990B|nr:thiol peroxidase [Marinoscillum sp. MHG1-6]
MAQIEVKGNLVNTIGELPGIGSQAPDFTLVKPDMSEVSLSEYGGKKVILNIFPSVDTSTCATSVRQFNDKATEIENTVVLCISADLPYAYRRFCAAEGIDNVETLSTFRSSFPVDYGVQFTEGYMKGLNSRAIVVLDESGVVIHTEQVPFISQEPNYEAALGAL